MITKAKYGGEKFVSVTIRGLGRMEKELENDFDFDFDSSEKKSKFGKLLKKQKTKRDVNKNSTIEIKGREEKRKSKKVSNETVNKIEKALGVEFSEEQLDVIKHVGSPLSVVSCAGSGKSTVLVAKMLYREMEYGVKPLNMLAITFNADAKADIEVKHAKARRKCKLTRRGKATFKTFHALFLMLLKCMDKYEDVDVENSTKYMYMLSKYVKGADDDDKPNVVEQMFGYRSTIINYGISTDGIENAESMYTDQHNFDLDNYLYIMEEYNSVKELEGVIDFEDMQTLLYKEIVEEGNKEPLKAFQRVWGDGDVYMDEYQDISKIQRDIMDNLIVDFKRLMVIGDDDQSIYSWRGSDPTYILDFKYTYSNASIKYLSTNYRCKSEIVGAVRPVIERNERRMKKNIEANEKGGHIEYIKSTGNLGGLIDELLEELEYTPSGFYEEIALLVRNNSQRMLLADELLEKNVPINIVNIKFSLQENSFYKTLIEVIQMIKNEDNKLFVKHFNKMFKHLNRYKVEHYLYEDVSWYVDITERMFYNIREHDIDMLEVIKGTNSMYNAFVCAWKLLKGHYKMLGDKGYGSFDKTQTIMKHILKHSKGMKIREFLDREKRKHSKLRLFCDSDEALSINTIHSVKGLEFESVYMIGMNNDILPDMDRYHSLIDKRGFEYAEEYLEEERRLFYVGWTRAAERLVVEYDSNNPSMFLKEVWKGEKAEN